MRLLVPTIVVALAACAPNPQTGNSGGTEATRLAGQTAAPADAYREVVLRSERLGRALYEKDVAAALATQLLHSAGMLAGDDRITGWVTQVGEGSMLVTYVAEESGRRMVRHEVVFPGGISSRPALAPTPPNTPLIGERAVMYAARDTAIDELTPVCEPPYNTVVLPGTMIGEQGWLVYLLASTLNPGERVMAGHSMVRVSADGLTSLGVTPLSLSCLIVPNDVPQGTAQRGIFVTHRATNWPLETHVYSSLLHGLPVYVRTQAGTWTVDGDKIELKGLAEDE